VLQPPRVLDLAGWVVAEHDEMDFNTRRQLTTCLFILGARDADSARFLLTGDVGMTQVLADSIEDSGGNREFVLATAVFFEAALRRCATADEVAALASEAPVACALRWLEEGTYNLRSAADQMAAFRGSFSDGVRGPDAG